MAAASPFLAALIGHTEIAEFAADSVNLKREDAEEYRQQVRNLRDKLDRYAADHPEHGLIKTLLSGSLAKGTALKTLNDIDIAFYVKGEKAPSKERELLEWLAQRVREAYPQMKADQIKVNRHSVCISYAVSGLNVDIVPVQYCGDPDDRGYLFPFDGGDPVLTSIPLHLQFIRIRKTLQKDHFAQVIRLVKWWVRKQREKDEDFRLKSFMAEMADAGKRLILRVVECSFCALFPVTGGLPHLDRLPHAVLDALGVLPGVAFAVVADENRLTKRDIVGAALRDWKPTSASRSATNKRPRCG